MRHEGVSAVAALACGGRDAAVNRVESHPDHWDPTDEALAREASKIARLLHIPIYAQMEVADLLDIESADLLCVNITAHRDNRKRLDTKEVLEQIKIRADDNGHHTILLVAHPIHMPRALRAARKIFGADNVFPIDTRDVPLDPLSKYPWVRSELRFQIYERYVATPIYRMRGWI